MALKFDFSMRLIVPDGVDFSDLKLKVDSLEGNISFDWSIFDKICLASEVDPSLLKTALKGEILGLIVGWYIAHKQAGERPDPIAERLFSEKIEDILAERVRIGQASRRPKSKTSPRNGLQGGRPKAVWKIDRRASFVIHQTGLRIKMVKVDDGWIGRPTNASKWLAKNPDFADAKILARVMREGGEFWERNNR